MTREEQDQSNWKAVADRVLAGEFDRATKSVLDSVAIGLGSYPVLIQASERISQLQDKLKNKNQKIN